MARPAFTSENLAGDQGSEKQGSIGTDRCARFCEIIVALSALLADNAAGGGWFLTAERPRRATVARTERAISKACAYLRCMFKAFEFCIPTRGIKVPSGSSATAIACG
jgi:hypothetical protein